MSVRTGLLFLGAPAVPEMVALAQRAERAGYDSVWVAETRLTRDAVAPVAAIALGTERLKVGTGIVNVYTRNPVLLALTFATLDELAPGRIVMGLGAGSPRVLAPQGVEFARPLTRLREYCEVIPRLIAGEEVTYHGAVVNLEGARIEDVLARDGGAGRRHADPAVPGCDRPSRRRVRRRGRRRRAAERVSPARLRGRAPRPDAGRGAPGGPDRRTGRDRDVRGRLAARRRTDGARRRAPVRRGVPVAVPQRGPRDRVGRGLRASTCGACSAEGGVDAAAPLVGDDVVNLLTAAGTVEDCRRRLDEYRAAGVELPVLAPVDGALELTIDALA